MTEMIFQTAVASPQELRGKLSTLKSNQYRFVSVSLADPQVYVYPFQTPKAPRKELIEHLIDEAVELSSLSINDIELDFQVFGAKEGVIEGVFAFMPRKLLEDYIAVCDEARLVPIDFTAQLLRAVGALYATHKGQKEHFVALDFLKDRVSVALFTGEHCAFLRQIKFESIEEARSDIIQSLRSASAKSRVKTIEHIYVGNVTGEAKTILRSIEESIGAPIITEGDGGTAQAPSTPDYFKVNLTHNYSFAALRRRQFDLGALVVLGLLGLIFVVTLGRLIVLQMKIGKIKSSYKAADVNYARDLEQKVENLK